MQDIDKLEDMPHREATHRHRSPKKGCACSWCQERRGDDYPWDRVVRWLRASVGDKWNGIIGDFIRLEWVPARYRTYTKLCEHVEVNTFERDGKVWFYPTYRGGEEVEVDKEYNEVLYVHPITKDLCYKKRTPRTHWAKIHEEEERKTMRILGDYHQLLRINGIWYEVKGVPEGISFNARMYGPRTRMMWDKPEKKTNAYLHHCWERPRIVLKRQLSKDELLFHKLRNVIDNEFTRNMKYGQT